jgi:exosome complex RNA-binding protein Rrp4
MRTIKSITDTYKSFYAANKALGLKQSNQLQRHVKMDAMVDQNGQVWIKTGSPIEALIGGAS